MAVLGSTGSVGRAAMSIIAEYPQSFNVVALACGYNIELLAQQAVMYRPRMLAVADEDHACRLRTLLQSYYSPQILSGAAGYATLAAHSGADCVLSAQVGGAGLAGTLAAVLAGKVVALANKESLVLAGSLIRKICSETSASILPVDSEHFALFQCLAGRDQSAQTLILTASGGPFWGKDSNSLRNAKAADALKHPNWRMGAKISIDSATMMNKGLEFIEAMHLYGVNRESVKILIHPQSIVHSLVCFKDNSQLAQLALPDMRLPIASCLLWPRCESSAVKPLDLATVGTLTFYEPDTVSFPCLKLAFSAVEYLPDNAWQNVGLNPACIVLNSANEAAVELFLRGECGFNDIASFIRKALQALVFTSQPASPSEVSYNVDIAQFACGLASLISALDSGARKYVAECCAGHI